jgi:hypothetical protein
MRLPEAATFALVVVDVLAAAAMLAAMGIAMTALSVARRRRIRPERRADSWEAFERAFWSYVAGQSRAGRRPRGRR